MVSLVPWGKWRQKSKHSVSMPEGPGQGGQGWAWGRQSSYRLQTLETRVQGPQAATWRCSRGRRECPGKDSVSVAQSCPTLCNPVDCSPPGSSVHEILQARRHGLPCPSPGDLPDPGLPHCRWILYHLQTLLYPLPCTPTAPPDLLRGTVVFPLDGLRHRLQQVFVAGEGKIHLHAGVGAHPAGLRRTLPEGLNPYRPPG